MAERPFFTLERTFIPEVRLDPEHIGLVVVDMQYNDASADEGFGLALSTVKSRTIVLEPQSYAALHHAS